MAGTNGRQAGGERVLESRHLVGLFLGVVLLCGVFFTLGYVMGKTQYGTTAVTNAASLSSPSPAPNAQNTTPAPTNANAHDPQSSEWGEFGDDKHPHLDAPKSGAAGSSGPPNSITPRGPSAMAKQAPAPAPPKEPAGYQPPAMGKGAIVLQLAALKREGDAMALADALKQKSFPSFVVTSTADSLYRVQVGPYTDLQAANVAKQSLAHEGFNSIIKR
jgi:cell division septation protein DedD